MPEIYNADIQITESDSRCRPTPDLPGLLQNDDQIRIADITVESWFEKLSAFSAAKK